MEKINMSSKKWVTVIILSIFCTLAIRFNTKPEVYSGYIYALIGIFFIGFYSANKIVGGGLGWLIVGLGLLLRNIWPQESTLTGEKLEAFLVEYNSYQDFIGKYFLVMVLGGLVLGVVGALVGNFMADKEISPSKKFSTKRITYLAIFVAMSVAINTARIGSVSFGGFPIISSGYLLGPVNGFIVGALADVVGFIIRPSATGGFNPLFILTSALTGFIPAFATKLLKEEYPKFSLVKILIGIGIGQLITSVILVPIFRVMLYGGNTFYYFAIQALIKQALSVPIYAFLVNAVNESLSRSVNLRKNL